MSKIKSSQEDTSVATSHSTELSCPFDSLTLVTLVRSALSDFLPEDAVNQFVLRNSINETLPVSRLDFILNQILLVIGMISSTEDDGLQEPSSDESNDLLEVVLSQCDSNMIPVDWTFHSLELSCDVNDSCWSQNLSLLEVLSLGNTLTEAALPPSNETELNPLETTRQMLNTLNDSSTEQLISDDMILSTLDAHNYDLDRAIATLTLTLEQLQEPTSIKGRTFRSGRVKKNSGVRSKGIDAIAFLTSPTLYSFLCNNLAIETCS